MGRDTPRVGGSSDLAFERQPEIASLENRRTEIVRMRKSERD